MKITKSNIAYFLIGAIIFSSITALAVTEINANQITYTDKNNQTKSIDAVLDDLYTKASFGNATANDIAYGKTALVGGEQITGTYSGAASNVATSTTSTDAPAYTSTEFKTGFQPKLVYIEATHLGSTYRYYWAEGSQSVAYQNGNTFSARNLNGTTGDYTSLTINNDGFSGARFAAEDI